MRCAQPESVRHAVAVFDMATSTTAECPHTTARRIAHVISAHRKTRGILQAERAVDLGSTRAASPLETAVRLIAQLDAGLQGLLVNQPLFDDGGELLGVADLFHPDTGLVLECDGAGHRELERHSADNVREERFEYAGLTVCRLTSLDVSDRTAAVGRIIAARRHAERAPEGRWRFDPPDWWSAWPPARRWD